MASIEKRKLICGVGINDSNYTTQKFKTVGYSQNGKKIRKLVWICPFFSCWKSMIERCYNEKRLTKYPAYRLCFVTENWLRFSNFKAWMEKQGWEGKQLDKDILVFGNKVYGPETCVFVSESTNKFLLDSKAMRGVLPIGVDFHKGTGKFRARCSDHETGDSVFLGHYSCAQEAHLAWLIFKQNQAKIVAEEQNDKRVAEAIINRYLNFTEGN